MTNKKIHFDNVPTAFAYRSSSELARAYLIFSILNKPILSNFMIAVVRLALLLRLPIMGLIKKTFFTHFCGGETIKECEQVAQNLSKYNVKTVLDCSAEEETTEDGFNKTAEEIVRTLEVSKENDMFPFCVFKVTGIGSSELLEKIQNKITLTPSEMMSFDMIKERIDTICSKAHAYKVSVFIDAEGSWFQDPVDEIAYEMMKKHNTQRAIVFNTFQMYRTDMLTHLKNAHHSAITHNYYLGIKIVRGAYMEIERKRAIKMRYPDRIHIDKQATDNNFNKGLDFCIKNMQNIALTCGSHNNYSNQYLTLLMERQGIPNDDKRIWFIQLYGMRDNISFGLATNGYNVAKYIPYGLAKSVIPYLMRRAQENTSVAGQSGLELELIRKEYKRRKQASK